MSEYENCGSVFLTDIGKTMSWKSNGVFRVLDNGKSIYYEKGAIVTIDGVEKEIPSAGELNASLFYSRYFPKH